jgi:hypothetical protein
VPGTRFEIWIEWVVVSFASDGACADIAVLEPKRSCEVAGLLVVQLIVTVVLVAVAVRSEITGGLSSTVEEGGAAGGGGGAGGGVCSDIQLLRVLPLRTSWEKRTSFGYATSSCCTLSSFAAMDWSWESPRLLSSLISFAAVGNAQR